MKAKTLTFEFGQKVFTSHLSTIPIDLAVNCPICGGESYHEILTITQYGILDDRVISVFGCPNCRQFFHFIYAVEARFGLADTPKSDASAAV